MKINSSTRLQSSNQNIRHLVQATFSQPLPPLPPELAKFKALASVIDAYRLMAEAQVALYIEAGFPSDHERVVALANEAQYFSAQLATLKVEG